MKFIWFIFMNEYAFFDSPMRWKWSWVFDSGYFPLSVNWSTVRHTWSDQVSNDKFVYIILSTWQHIINKTYPPVSACFNRISSSLSQKSPPQSTYQWSPVSPSPSLPYADTSWLPDRGELNKCEWRFFLVDKCVSLITLPHLIGSLKYFINSK